jgi:hypothetical protein
MPLSVNDRYNRVHHFPKWLLEESNVYFWYHTQGLRHEWRVELSGSYTGFGPTIAIAAKEARKAREGK